MNAVVGCGLTDEIGEACALIENDDASTLQVSTNDNLLNMDKTPPLARLGYITNPPSGRQYLTVMGVGQPISNIMRENPKYMDARYIHEKGLVFTASPRSSTGCT
jgi:hypothetical protein